MYPNNPTTPKPLTYGEPRFTPSELRQKYEEMEWITQPLHSIRKRLRTIKDAPLSSDASALKSIYYHYEKTLYEIELHRFELATLFGYDPHTGHICRQLQNHDEEKEFAGICARLLVFERTFRRCVKVWNEAQQAGLSHAETWRKMELEAYAPLIEEIPAAYAMAMRPFTVERSERRKAGIREKDPEPRDWYLSAIISGDTILFAPTSPATPDRTLTRLGSKLKAYRTSHEKRPNALECLRELLPEAVAHEADPMKTFEDSLQIVKKARERVDDLVSGTNEYLCEKEKIKQWKHGVSEFSLEDGEIAEPADPADLFRQFLDSEDIKHWLKEASLSPKEEEAFLLYLDEFTETDISKKMRQAVGTTRSELYRAKQKLRSLFPEKII